MSDWHVGAMAIDRLTAEDRLMLEADRQWPQDYGAIAFLDGTALIDGSGQLRIDDVRQWIAGRLHRVRRFRQVIYEPRRALGGPLWLDDDRFDVRQHVQLLPLAEGSGEAELLLAVERIRRERLDPTCPPWEIWLLPGLADRRVGLFLRVQHALGDGRAALTMLGALLDPQAELGNEPPPRWQPVGAPRASALLADNIWQRVRGGVSALSAPLHPRRALATLPAMRELITDSPASATSLNKLIGRGRTFALIRTSTREIRRVARMQDASSTDVLLSLVAGGLRAVLLARGEPVEGVTMRAYVPVSLRGVMHGPVTGNLISQMAVPLPLTEADLVARLHAIAAETASRKKRARPTMGALFRLDFVRRRLMKALAAQRANVIATALQGPRRPMYLCGARLLEIFPVLNLFGNQTLGVGALSSMGAFNIGVIADLDAVPDLDVFAAGVTTELRLLAGAPAGEADLVTQHAA